MPVLIITNKTNETLTIINDSSPIIVLPSLEDHRQQVSDEQLETVTETLETLKTEGKIDYNVFMGLGMSPGT